MNKNIAKKIVDLFNTKYSAYTKIVINMEHPSRKLKRFIQEKVKIEVSSYYHQIDNYSLKHIQKNHPNKGLECFKYKKAFNGTTYYIEEIRTGSKTLSLKTMYKRKTPPGASHAS